MNRLAAGVLLTTVGCATPYTYSFHLENPGARTSQQPKSSETLEDADVRAEILVDPTQARAVRLELTNRTDQVLQVAWTQIAMNRFEGGATSLRPQMDLGWILPGATASTSLVPFSLPPTGDEAAGYQGNHFELVVPMIIRRESRSYRYSFTVGVRKI